MKINLYFNSVKVKSVKIKDKENWKKDYKVTIWFKKKYFGESKVTLILRPVRLLASTEKEYDLDCIVYQGVNLVDEQFEGI